MRKVALLAVMLPCLLGFASSADAALNVPLYLQYDSRWGDDLLDHSSSVTIADAGCALTCCVMVVRYYGVSLGPSGEDVNPGTLNVWLKKNHGFVRLNIVWAAVARFTQLAKDRNNNNSIKFVAKIQKGKQDTQSIVDADLTAGKPVLLNVKDSGHFVVCTGKSESTYSINDPAGRSNTLLSYGNTWQGIRRYARASGPEQLLTMEDDDYSSLSIWCDAWVDLCLVDSQGLRTGIDPTTGQEANEIQDSSYGLETAVTDELWGDPIGPDSKFADVITPASSSYTLKVFSTAGQSGGYTISVYSLDPDANYYYQEISGYLDAGEVNEHTIIQPAIHSIPVAKSYVGADFELRDKAVSSASDSVAGMYIQEQDRSAGIKVVPNPSDPNLPYLVGDVVNAAGLIELADGELQVSNAQISRISSGSTVAAVGMPNRSLGGTAFADQPGITGACGLNNTGLLARLWGIVTYVGSDHFYIDDGSGLADGSGHTGVRIVAPGLSLPSLNEYVAVTGISSNTTINDNTARTLKMRGQSDL